MHGVSIENSDLTGKYNVLIKTSFDTQTKWPPKNKLPKNFDPQKIIEISKDPGLGIKALHKSGITGKGVRKKEITAYGADINFLPLSFFGWGN